MLQTHGSQKALWRECEWRWALATETMGVGVDPGGRSHALREGTGPCEESTGVPKGGTPLLPGSSAPVGDCSCETQHRWGKWRWGSGCAWLPPRSFGTPALPSAHFNGTEPFPVELKVSSALLSASSAECRGGLGGPVLVPEGCSWSPGSGALRPSPSTVPSSTHVGCAACFFLSVNSDCQLSGKEASGWVSGLWAKSLLLSQPWVAPGWAMSKQSRGHWVPGVFSAWIFPTG